MLVDVRVVRSVEHLIVSKASAEINHNKNVEKTSEVDLFSCSRKDKIMRKALSESAESAIANCQHRFIKVTKWLNLEPTL